MKLEDMYKLKGTGEILEYVSDNFDFLIQELEILNILKQNLVIETMDNENTSWEQVNCYLTKGKNKSLENDEEFDKVKKFLEE